MERFTLTEQALPNALQRNLVILSLLTLAAAVGFAASFVAELLGLLAAALFAAYFLLDGVNALERFYGRLFPRGELRQRLPKPLSNLPIPSICRRFLAVLTGIFSLLVVIAIAARIAIPVISQEIGGFLKALPGYYQTMERQLDAFGRAQWGDRALQRLMTLPASDAPAAPNAIKVLVSPKAPPPATPASQPPPSLKPPPEGVDPSSAAPLEKSQAMPVSRPPEKSARPEKAVAGDSAPSPDVGPAVVTALAMGAVADETPPLTPSQGVQTTIEKIPARGSAPADAATIDASPRSPERSEERPSRLRPTDDVTVISTPSPAPTTSPPLAAPAETPQAVVVTVTPAASSANAASRPSALEQLLNVFRRTVISPASINVVDLLGASLTGLVYTLTALALLFYFLLDGRRIAAWFVHLFPETRRPLVEELLLRTHHQFHGLVRIQILTSAVTGLLLYACFALILRIDYAGFLSAFFAASALFPAIGPWFGALPSALALLMDGRWLSLALMLSGLGAFYLFKQRWALPRVFGPRSDIHPILSILTQLACIRVMGVVPGLLTALPLSCLLMSAWRIFAASRRLRAAAAAAATS